MKNKTIFCIGHASFDITFPLKEYPRENDKIRTHSKIECGGGSASNACVLLALWGYQSYFIGAVGDDYFGDRVIGAFDHHGVNTTYLYQLENNYTSTSFIVSANDTGKRTIVTFKDKDLYLEPFDININADVILCDGEYLELTQKLIADNPHALKIIDAGSAKNDTLTLCYAMDYVVCSKSFAEEVTKKKFNFRNKDNLKKIYDALEEKFKTKIIITLEEKGSYTKIDDEYILIPSITVDVIDSTGAGDIYHGALTYFLANDYDIKEAMRLSNIAGALACTKLGGRFSIPTLRDVLDYDK